jgi:putative Mg2+ transporter-C (MgtC) family protein
MNSQWEYLLRLAIAAVFGIILGLERELKRKPLGLKTCLVICVSSCLLTIVSIESATRFWYKGLSTNMPDPMRLAAQIVSGVGFLGAGVILRRNNEVVSGLTTAAMVWAASGLGIATGAGFFREAFVGVALIIISVEFMPIVIRKIGPAALREKEVHLRLVVAEDDIDSILRHLEEKQIHIENMQIRSHEKGYHLLNLQVIVNRSLHPVEIYREVSALPHVVGVEVQS